MSKLTVKILKRNKKGGVKKAQVKAMSAKAESDIQPNLVSVINKWISERRENSRVEKIFSDNKILAWKIASKDFKETIS